MRRAIHLLLPVLLLAVAAPAIVAASAPPEWTTVAIDPCTPGPDVEQPTSPDWEDLCSIEVRTMASVDGPTAIDVRFTAVGDIGERSGPVWYETTWTTGSCEVRLVHRDETELAPARDTLEAVCGQTGEDCEVPPLVTCTPVADVVLDVDITPPTVDGPTLTWSLTFDGELAELAPAHAAGTELVWGRSEAADAPAVSTVGQPGPGVTSEQGGGFTPDVCVGPTCIAPLDDFVTGGGIHVVSGG